jgi:hypothetical protein
MLVNPDSKIVNTRGCGPLMNYWYRRGFWENIFMSLFGVAMGAYMLFVSQRNRREFTQLRDEAEDRRRIVHAHSVASLRSMNNNNMKQGPSSASNFPRYSYTGLRNSTPNRYQADEDESDNNEEEALYRPRPLVNA